MLLVLKQLNYGERYKCGRGDKFSDGFYSTGNKVHCHSNFISRRNSEIKAELEIETILKPANELNP
jgi:hypothetical protein